MRWLELVDDQRVFLVRAEPDLWAEIERGALVSLDLLRPGRGERLPRFQQGDVLLLYRPRSDAPDSLPAELGQVVRVRSELSNGAGYGLGPLFRLVPPLGRERLLFASQQGGVPEVFQRTDDRTFTLAWLTADQRNEFLEYVVTAGIALRVEERQGGPSVVPPPEEAPGIVEFDW
jgi:hypothetical protein